MSTFSLEGSTGIVEIYLQGGRWVTEYGIPGESSEGGTVPDEVISGLDQGDIESAITTWLLADKQIRIDEKISSEPQVYVSKRRFGDATKKTEG